MKTSNKQLIVKTLPASRYEQFDLGSYPNFHVNGNITGMKKQYYGIESLLVRCGNYIYNVTINPEIYHQAK